MSWNGIKKRNSSGIAKCKVSANSEKSSPFAEVKMPLFHQKKTRGKS